MNRIFSTIFAGNASPLDPESRTIFINECTDLFDRLSKNLTEYSKSLQTLMSSEYGVTHDFHRFGYRFDPEDEKSSISLFVSILSSVGNMGNKMIGQLELRKKEIDGQLLRVNEMPARLSAYTKFIKGKKPDDPAVLNAFNSLKFDCTSEIIDQCIRLCGSHFKICFSGSSLIQPVMENQVPQWRQVCYAAQDTSLAIRKTAPMAGDALLTRGCTTRIFETDLSKLPLIPGYGIPQVLFDTSNALLNIPGTLEQVGLLRENAARRDLDEVKNAYDQGQIVNIWRYSPNVIAGTMKLWIRELPDSVIPGKIGASFAAAAQEGPVKLKKLLNELPEVNRRCLHKLIEVGYNVAKHSDKNKMTADNVAIVFGPIIIRREDELNPLTSIANLNALAKNLIENYNILFGPFNF